MPELIPDVFENIVTEFRYKANVYDSNRNPSIIEAFQCSNPLEKFMLSGSKPLNSALTYFSRAERIELFDKFFAVTVKNGLADIYNNKNKHCFVYCFKLLKPLLKVLLQSNGRLEIHHSLQGHDQNLVFETLLEAGLKSVVLSAKLCPKYFDMLKTQSSLKSVYADYNFHCSSLFYDIFAIPAASHSIDNCTGDIKIHDIPEDLFFPEVKDLTMYWRDLINITAEDFSRLSLQIVLNYPNLKNIYFAFQILYCEQHIQKSVVALQSNAFEFIPDHIHGNIVINSRMKGEEYKNMLHQLTNDPDFQYDSEKRVFKKTQLIHDRLCIVFKIEICLPSFMTS